MKPIVLSGFLAFLLVKYLYRQGKDCYIVADSHPVFCSQCKTEMSVEDLVDHIRYHDKRKGKADIIAIKDGKTFVIESLVSK